MSSAAAEKLVKELARKPSNTVCANCGTKKKFGFSTVCIKYHTFVCNNCKSSHQAISHRCKSLTMSSWTNEEVAELKRKGNDYARRTWLKNAPPVGQGGRPKEGDSVDVFKRFVVEAYERKKYYGEDDGTGGGVHPAPTAAPAPRVAPKQARAPVRRAVPPPAPAPAPVADLLDFTSTSSTTPQSVTGTSSNTFEANFDAFAPTTASAPSGPSATAAVQNDPFTARAAPASNASGFNFMNNRNSATQPAVPPAPVVPAIKKPVMKTQTTTQAPVSNSSNNAFQANFDAFAPSSSAPASTNSTTTAVQNDPFQPTATPTSNGSGFSFMNNSTSTPSTVPAIKKPVMNNPSMSQKSSLISSMNIPSQQGHQNNMGMGMGMGFNNNNSGMNNNAFGAMGNMNSLQSQMMMQQQQMNMMNGMMNGMNLNNNGMGMGGMGMMGNNNNNPMMMMGNNNMMMMNQQRNMMNGNSNFGGMNNNSKGNSNGAMQSLQMNMSSMNAWSSGGK